MNQQFCTQCGTKLPEVGKFCTQCGTPIEHMRAPSVAQAQVTPTEIVNVLNSRRWLPRFGPIGAVAVVAVGVMLGMALYDRVISPATQMALPVDSGPIPDDHSADGIPYPEVPRITVEEARSHLDNGIGMFVDVRDRQSYATAHIPGSVSLPLSELDLRYAELPKDAEIITYCT
jgi:hypothetical protein